uniref:Exonuclease domain-containing protein n=1 Tax=Corethron hystrix TaxID=216773 RepID=A0A7S1BK40_9STRA|mmetsp:Transcript_28686/g.65544  ORF Transcript_28686/g.65544 Transcript_28686/m.65544 type:complete len:639 (+) Transcript_28686:57-1973(+)
MSAGDGTSAAHAGAQIRDLDRAEWDRHHSPNPSTGIPIALYTDENPATTIKGTGFRDREMAERTIVLTSQSGVRYKQYWTIRAMRERAAHHPSQTKSMREAMEVFDDWIASYQRPTAEERRRQEEEWRRHRALCDSAANAHSYGKFPSEKELIRARDNTKEARILLVLLLSHHRPSPVKIPLSAFIALFGGPGLHGYGKHDLNSECSFSRIATEGERGLRELLGHYVKRLPIGMVETLKSVSIAYDHKEQMATATIEKKKHSNTLEHFWNGKKRVKIECSDKYAHIKNCGQERTDVSKQTWTCATCTLRHEGASKQRYTSCELCGAARVCLSDVSKTPFVSSAKVSLMEDAKMPSPSKSPRQARSSWGCLRAPTKKDIVGPRKRQKGLDRPPPTFDYLVVLDFEWTADNKRKMEPVAEITQFPSVLMKLFDSEVPANCVACTDERISSDLKYSCKRTKSDAICVAVFDAYVKPTINPKLTDFSIELTAITQDMVDTAPTIDTVLHNYVTWLGSLGLLDSGGNQVGNWAFVTWGDCDISRTLRMELAHKSIDLPQCFHQWINLKDAAIYRRHYGREPKGGLRACVESTGFRFEGRAHNGLVDSINTAKIVRHMVQTGFRFVRTTQGLDKNGLPFGAASR